MPTLFRTNFLLGFVVLQFFLPMTTASIVPRISYRRATPSDIKHCLAIEEASYPADEAATLESLTLRQQNAGQYFQCAVLDDKEIVGFVCSTRCHLFEEDSMVAHEPTGALLAIHSVVIEERYRRQGVATAMLKAYLEKIRDENLDGTIRSIILLAKSHLLGFYVNCGFRVNRPSPIVHGKELWYELEKPLIRQLPVEGESWFCKTEQFKQPFSQVKPHLEAHKEWVAKLRRQGKCITSGYRVDENGQPGGGGLLFLAAKNYHEALALVEQDPLVANDCVNWQLNGFRSQVGELQLR